MKDEKDKATLAGNGENSQGSAYVQRAVNHYRKAVSLQYDGVTAPEVTALGEGQIAEDIIAIAQASGVPLYENAELTEMLSMLDLGDQIPQELYVLIAQIIALAYKLKNEIPAPG